MTFIVGALIFVAGIWLWRKGMEYERKSRR